ncbi:hypothetical protein ACC848_05655 [Rhizobium johnstonii]|uniref:hypothetical protein n=1 Tax=Rhizobium johnstonii TaxID=3019933 RepID=UPI003F9DDD4C
MAEQILDEFAKNAPDLDSQIIKSIRIEVDGRDHDVYGVRAQIINGRREIIIPIGFIAATYDVNIAFADKLRYSAISYIKTDDLSEYIKYVSDTLKESDIGVRTSGYIPEIMNFCVFRKLAKEECAARDSDPDLLKIVSRIEYSALSFVIGHEIGHHVRGHLGNGKLRFLTEREVSSQSMETEADIYSTKSMIRSEQLVDGAMATMFLFSYLKGEAALTNSSDDHPPPLCRWITLLETQLEELPKCEKLMQMLLKQGLNLEGEKAGIDAVRAAVPQCPH